MSPLQRPHIDKKKIDSNIQTMSNNGVIIIWKKNIRSNLQYSLMVSLYSKQTFKI